jgi:hypothetical protein
VSPRFWVIFCSKSTALPKTFLSGLCADGGSETRGAGGHDRSGCHPEPGQRGRQSSPCARSRAEICLLLDRISSRPHTLEGGAVVGSHIYCKVYVQGVSRGGAELGESSSYPKGHCLSNPSRQLVVVVLEVASAWDRLVPGDPLFGSANKNYRTVEQGCVVTDLAIDHVKSCAFEHIVYRNSYALLIMCDHTLIT